MALQLSRNSACREHECYIDEAVEYEEKLCNVVKTVTEYKYTCVIVSVGGECEAVVTARTRCGWMKVREYGIIVNTLLYRKKLLHTKVFF